LDEFRIGDTKSCKACADIRKERNAESTKAAQKRHAAKKREEFKLLPIEEQERIKAEQRAYDAAYYEANQDKILDRKVVYQIENNEAIMEYKREYAKENRDKIREISRACAHKRRASHGKLTVMDVREIKQAAEGKCCYCKHPADILELEHFIPLSRGGINAKENCGMACRPCNRRKGAKTVYEFVNNLRIGSDPEVPYGD
jgi:5-methylcytosine-specific restriction endonuclease McrA